MTEQSFVTEITTTLDLHRGFLLHTADGLTEEQARTRSTVSELTIAGILKHVADTEEQWLRFAVEGPSSFDHILNADVDWSQVTEDPRFVLSDEETLDVLRQRVTSVGARTSELLASLDLDTAHPLPKAPWFEPGASWSVRRVALHVLAEISQHAGHADIIREAIDGQKTMG